MVRTQEYGLVPVFQNKNPRRQQKGGGGYEVGLSNRFQSIGIRYATISEDDDDDGEQKACSQLINNPITFTRVVCMLLPSSVLLVSCELRYTHAIFLSVSHAVAVWSISANVHVEGHLLTVVLVRTKQLNVSVVLQ